MLEWMNESFSKKQSGAWSGGCPLKQKLRRAPHSSELRVTQLTTCLPMAWTQLFKEALDVSLLPF